jgi:hypothetical protein
MRAERKKSNDLENTNELLHTIETEEENTFLERLMTGFITPRTQCLKMHSDEKTARMRKLQN